MLPKGLSNDRASMADAVKLLGIAFVKQKPCVTFNFKLNNVQGLRSLTD